MKNGIQYLVSIDAGGSKTSAALVSVANQQKWTLSGGGASLSHNFDRAKQRIKDLAFEIVSKADASASECLLVCGAAGAACEENSRRLKGFLGEDWAQVAIESDARTSLYGACQGEPMLVVAVGTGSVAMRLSQDGSEKMFGGYGFESGDLGSGAFIGRLAVTRYLVINEQRETLANTAERLQPDPLVDYLSKLIGRQRQSILDWLKPMTAAEYAALAPAVFDFLDTSSLSRWILSQAVASIEELIDIGRGDQDLPVALIGGLANKIAGYLSQEHQSYLVTAKGDAVDGGLFLAEQMLKATKG